MSMRGQRDHSVGHVLTMLGVGTKWGHGEGWKRPLMAAYGVSYPTCSQENQAATHRFPQGPPPPSLPPVGGGCREG